MPNNSMSDFAPGADSCQRRYAHTNYRLTKLGAGVLCNRTYFVDGLNECKV